MKKFKLICIFLITTTPNLAASQREQRSFSEDSALRKSSFDDQLVRFPPKEILRVRLHSIGFDEFDEQTNLVEGLVAGRFHGKTPIGVAMHVECAYQNFTKQAQRNSTPEKEINEIIEKKSLLFETLCESNPESLNEIKKTGLYQPKKIVLIKANSL